MVRRSNAPLRILPGAGVRLWGDGVLDGVFVSCFGADFRKTGLYEVLAFGIDTFRLLVHTDGPRSFLESFRTRMM